MQISVILTLTVLLLSAAGFLLGRRRAMTGPKSDFTHFHSLPNYHGYFVALWTGIPAISLIVIYGLFGGLFVKSLAVVSLENQAKPLIAAYQDALLNDKTYQDLLLQIQSLQDQTGRQDELSQRVEEIQEGAARNIMARVAPSKTGSRAIAGFEIWRADLDQRARMMDQAYFFFRHNELKDSAPQAIANLVKAMTWPDRLLKTSTIGLVLAFGFACLLWARSKIRPLFRSRIWVETVIESVLALASLMAILTTFGIIISLLFETLRFFIAIDWRIHEFLFGLKWSPQIAIRADQIGQSGAFGAVPLFAGTALITFIAMAIATPIGLLAAIYLSEYASRSVRSWTKPILELLAGIPTVVYGFFALLTVGPILRDLALWLGYEDAVTQSALSAGLVMGVMIIPFVSSLCDDVINAVPQSLRDGSYAMGATKSETITRVVIPASFPGIMGALLLGISRAIGETMIVVMAAGQAARLTANPLESVTTITAQIVMLLTGDQEFNSPKTLSAFALGLVLMVLTLVLNVLALRVVQRFRQRYE